MLEYSKVYNNRLKIKSSISVTSVITMFYYDFTANYRSGREKHNFWEFVYVDNGRVIATADDSTYIINKGEMIFHKPDEMHSVKCDGVTPANIFIMTFVANGTSMNFFKNKIINVPYNLQGILAAIVDEMQSAYGENPGFISTHPNSPFGAEQMIKNYLEMFLILAKRSLEKEDSNNSYIKITQQHNSSSNKLVHTIITALENNVYKNISIDELCMLTSYGKSQLCETFKKTTGKTVLQYFTELKINEAKMLMRELKLNNSQISDRLGFSSPQYFTRVFKQITQMTPAEYKRSIKYR